MTEQEKLEAADKILVGSYINTETLVDYLTRDGFVTTITKDTDIKRNDQKPNNPSLSTSPNNKGA